MFNALIGFPLGYAKLNKKFGTLQFPVLINIKATSKVFFFQTTSSGIISFNIYVYSISDRFDWNIMKVLI